jgi:uncharacterized coiled-coil DUF342 family protein
MPYIKGTGKDDKCVFKKTKDGKRGAKVGCTRDNVKQYLKALYANNPKEAKNELAKIVEAMELGKKHDELMNEMMGMADVAKSHYDNMKSETYEEQLKEIEKLHDEMRRLYNDISKLEK